MIYLSREDHGGGCCGVDHLFNFPDLEDIEEDFGRKPTLKEKIAAIEPHLDRARGGETLEVVLTRQQAKVWERALQRCGFRRVMEFSNPNTNNILRMYLSTNNLVKSVRKGKK